MKTRYQIEKPRGINTFVVELESGIESFFIKNVVAVAAYIRLASQS